MPLERPPENLTTWGSEACLFARYRNRYSLSGSNFADDLRNRFESVSLGTLLPSV